MLLSTDDMFFHINRKDPDFVRVIERCQGRLDSYISDLDNELYGLATKASGIMKRLIAAWGGGARTGGFETVTTDWGNCLLDVVELVYKTWNGLSMREMLVNHPADGLSGYQETGGANLWVEHEGDFMGNQAGEISDHQRVVRDMAIALGAGQQYLCFVYHALEDRSRGKDGGALLLDPAGIFGKWILPHNYVQEDPGFMTCAYILRDGILDLASKTRTAKALQPDCDDFRVLYLLLNARREAATRAWEGRFCCKNAASLNDSSTDVSADKQKGNGCWDTTVPVVAGQQRGVKRRTIEGTGVGGLDQQKTLGSVRDDANCVRSQGSSDGNPVAHHSFSVDKKEHLPQHAVEKRRNKPVEIDAIRIAFGKKLEYQDCKLSFDPRQNTLELSYEKRSMTTRRSQDGERASHDIDCKLTAEQLLEIKYFIDDENNDLEVDDEVVTNFLAVRVIKNRGNGLLQFSNAYKPDRGELEKRFIVAECRSDDELRELINAMKGQRDIMPFITAETKLTQVNKNDFCRALNEDDRRAVKRRAGLKKPRAGFIAGKGEEDTLVVFPFAGDANEIDGAANGLGRELSICLRQELPPGGGAAAVVEEMLDGSSSAEESVTGEDSGGGSAAVLSLRVMDFERLDPPEYLNDTLIDFWMKWCVYLVVELCCYTRRSNMSWLTYCVISFISTLRMRRNTDASDIHIFTTLFYTTLVDEGTQAVANWTQKKKRPIRIFEKKLIFIPGEFICLLFATMQTTCRPHQPFPVFVIILQSTKGFTGLSVWSSTLARSLDT